MQIDKGDLTKVLRVVAGFDNQACAFIGVQLPENESPSFLRTSVNGFIAAGHYILNAINTQTIYASLGNLRDLLNVSADVMDLSIDSAGKLRLESNEGIRLQVHTVRKEVTGFKEHYLGDPTRCRYDSTIFDGFDIRLFKLLTTPPLLEGGRLLVSTISGTVIWTSDSLKNVVFQPREAFLRFVAGGGATVSINVTNQGYWITEKGGLVCAMSAHSTPTELMKVYSLPGTELTRFHAPRLLASLSSVSNLTADTDRVELNPKDGIVCRDKYSNPQIFPHGATTTTWARGSIFGRTAKFIVDALGQATEDEAILYSVPLRNPTYRIVRGPFEVNFGLI